MDRGGDRGLMNMPSTIDDIYTDFCGRHAGLLKAMTTDFELFWQQCDPGRGDLALLGCPDGTWRLLATPVQEVDPPAHPEPSTAFNRLSLLDLMRLAPPDHPEPALGINVMRDDLVRRDWLCLVAMHSDAWLLAHTFFRASSFASKKEREQLFKKINKHPTLLDLMQGSETVYTSPSATNSSQRRRRSNIEHVSAERQTLNSSRSAPNNLQTPAHLINQASVSRSNVTERRDAIVDTTDHDDHMRSPIANIANNNQPSTTSRSIHVDFHQPSAAAASFNMPRDEVDVPRPLYRPRPNTANRPNIDPSVERTAAPLSGSLISGNNLQPPAGRSRITSAASVIPKKTTHLPKGEYVLQSSDEDDESNVCGSCGLYYNDSDDALYDNDKEFWISCDVCKRWYHGKCVNVTPAKANLINEYTCPSCISRRRSV